MVSDCFIYASFLRFQPVGFLVVISCRSNPCLSCPARSAPFLPFHSVPLRSNPFLPILSRHLLSHPRLSCLSATFRSSPLRSTPILPLLSAPLQSFPSIAFHSCLSVQVRSGPFPYIPFLPYRFICTFSIAENTSDNSFNLAYFCLKTSRSFSASDNNSSRISASERTSAVTRYPPPSL